MGNLGWGTLAGGLAVIGAGLWKKFFSTGAKRNKIRRLQDEVSRLFKNGGDNKRIDKLMSQLKRLRSELQDHSE